MKEDSKQTIFIENKFIANYNEFMSFRFRMSFITDIFKRRLSDVDIDSNKSVRTCYNEKEKKI